MIDRLLKIIVIFQLISPFFATIFATEEKNNQLASIIKQSIAYNNTIKALQAQAKIHAFTADVVGSLPDPKLNYQLQNIPEDTLRFNQSPMTAIQLGFSQTIPFPGKRNALERNQQSLHDEKQRLRDNAILSLIRDLKKLYARYYRIHKDLVILRENRKLLTSSLASVETLSKTGRQLQHAVVKAALAVQQNELTIAKTNQQRREVKGLLNVAMGKMPDTHLETPNDIKIFTQIQTLDFYYQRAIQNHPQLKASVARLHANGHLISHRQKQFLPDITVSAGYRFREPNRGDDGTNHLTLGLTMNIPLYFATKQRQDVRRFKAVEQQLRSEVAATRDALLRKVHTSFHALVDIKEQLTLYRTKLIPSARLSEKTAASAFDVGRMSFNGLLTAQITRFKVEQNYFHLISDYAQYAADLEFATGDDLK